MAGNNYQGQPGKMPQMIKCSACRINKDTKTGFSNVALNKYKNFVYKQQQAGKTGGRQASKESVLFVTCIKCTASQRQDMTCRICHKTKKLNYFSKAQRKTPDEARCLECMRATELVLPISADDLVGNSIPEDDEDDDDDDDMSFMSRRRTRDPFVKDSTGQYYSSFNDDVSSVSNVWSSRAGSELDFPATGTRSNNSQNYIEDESLYSQGIPSSTYSNSRVASSTLTSENMAALNKKLNKLDIDEDGGTMPLSLARSFGAKKVVLKDSDSDESVATVRGQSVTNKSPVGGVPITNAGLVDKKKQKSTYSKASSYKPSESNDSSDDDDDDYIYNRPTISRQNINIYGGTDGNHRIDSILRESATNSPRTNWQTKNGKNSTNLASQSLASQHGNVSSMSTDPSIDGDDSNDTPIDFKSVSRGDRIAASGFNYNKHGKSNQRFPRVRPSNMLASEFEKSLLFRKNDDTRSGNKSFKAPDDVDSDDEW